MKSKRFRVIYESGMRVNHLLTSLGYAREEQDAIEAGSKEVYTIMDTLRHTFWLVDNESLVQSADFTKKIYHQQIHEINF